MTVALLEALSANLLEYKHLVCSGLVVYNCCLYNSALYIRSTDFYLACVVYEEDLVELYISTLGLRKSLDKDFVSSFYFELLACNFYDCVHIKLSVKSFGRKRLPSRQLFINGLTVI